MLIVSKKVTVTPPLGGVLQCKKGSYSSIFVLQLLFVLDFSISIGSLMKVHGPIIRFYLE